MDKIISSITENVLNKFASEVNRESNKKVIMTKIIEPLLQEIFSRYYVHFISVTVVLVLIIILLIIILIMAIVDRTK